MPVNCANEDGPFQTASENNSLADVSSKLALNPVSRSKLNILPPESPPTKSEQDKVWDILAELN
ncbi:hypothetical protein [Tunturiibacter lichenicola]|jgi:hypothetical protein|uniref:hypothetical protein n=1 Tax=Tunturiibacter lichenicola TaxID=2051959 RepID=UPI003D9B2827